MAGFTAKHKKDSITYSFRGDLQECIDKAEKELKAKQGGQEGMFLLWQYQRAKKALETHDRRIEDLKGFIKTAKEELKKREEKKADGKENSDRTV